MRMFPKVLIFILTFFIFSCTNTDQTSFDCKPFGNNYVCPKLTKLNKTCTTVTGNEGIVYFLSRSKIRTDFNEDRRNSCNEICLTEMDIKEESFEIFIHNKSEHKLCLDFELKL